MPIPVQNHQTTTVISVDTAAKAKKWPILRDDGLAL